MLNFRFFPPPRVECRLLVALAASATVLAATPWVFADSASWIYAGGGASRIEMPGLQPAENNLMQLEAGMGTNPRGFLVFGGVAKTLTHFASGTDLVLSQRTTTSGFSMGAWGAALDLGGYARFWGGNSTGLTAAVVVDAPWGINLSLLGAYGSNEEQMLAVTIGIDWARMTVHRTSGENWWPNYPLPVSEQARR